ncbi:MAG: dihydrodipicolinate synthase family protein [Acidimicrobiales bacterium]
MADERTVQGAGSAPGGSGPPARAGAGARFAGVYVATSVAFGADGSLDLDRFQEHCAWLAAEGVHGVVPNGSLGEYEALTEAERADVVTAAVEAVAGAARGGAADAGPVEVVPGVSGKSAAEAARWAEQAAGAGARAVMCLPPTSHRPTGEEVVAHFSEVAKVGLPVIAYNNPFSTRVDLVPELLSDLAGIDQVKAVKEFSQDVRRVPRILRAAPGLEVICGCDDTFVESMLHGAVGWIAGFANAFPSQSVRLYEDCVAGRWEDAVALYQAMLPILSWDADPRFVQAIKAGQEEAGRYGGPVRLPRLPLPPDEEAEVREAARAALAAGAGAPAGHRAGASASAGA